MFESNQYMPLGMKDQVAVMHSATTLLTSLVEEERWSREEAVSVCEGLAMLELRAGELYESVRELIALHDEPARN